MAWRRLNQHRYRWHLLASTAMLLAWTLFLGAMLLSRHSASLPGHWYTREMRWAAIVTSPEAAPLFLGASVFAALLTRSAFRERLSAAAKET